MVPVRENLQDVGEEIAEKGDETVILCMDDSRSTMMTTALTLIWLSHTVTGT